jgi:hypothetical protein
MKSFSLMTLILIAATLATAGCVTARRGRGYAPARMSGVQKMARAPTIRQPAVEEMTQPMPPRLPPIEEVTEPTLPEIAPFEASTQPPSVPVL